MEDFLEFATEIVRETAQLIVGRTAIHHHKEDGQPVTDGDLCAEDHILAAIRKNFPDHGAVSEEGGGYSKDSRYVWILDPIDGTRYYAAGLPLYAISLALQLDGELVLGVVYSPMLKQMFSAASGNGATLNGNTIHCSRKTNLAESYVCLEIPSRSSPSTEVDWALGKVRKLISHSLRVRILGVGSLGLCFSAMGAFDVFVNLGSTWMPWDVAAGQIILTESGAKFSRKGKTILAAPPGLHSELENILDLGDHTGRPQ